MKLDFTGKSVVITGAGGGIGRASALAFAASGAVVVVNDINEAMAQETAELVKSGGGQAVVVTSDVTVEENVNALVRHAYAHCGRLDVMFNNAGGAFPAPMLKAGNEEYRRVMALNMDAVYYGTMAALEVMIPAGGGVILSTASGAGINAVPGLAAYGAAKAGVIALMKSVAVEYGRQGIRANAISPGAMETPGLVSWLETLPGGVKHYSDAQPQGRLGRAEEIADAAVYLASDRASFVNGTTLAVDGAVQAALWHPL